jgi:hypothetical protein
MSSVLLILRLLGTLSPSSFDLSSHLCPIWSFLNLDGENVGILKFSDPSGSYQTLSL